MKVLVADSGSTKCDWMCIDAQGRVLAEFHTMGFNPYFHDSQLVEDEMRASKEAMTLASDIDRVYFYGAGSSTEKMCGIIQAGLEQVFPKAVVQVGHDLEGAAFSTYQGEPSITCIIGTGSNSCYFDGEKVSEEVPALAYILGDEASGSWFGKKLLAQYMYKKLDPAVHEDFEKTYHFSKDDLIYKVYKEPNANVFLAGFMTFIAKHRDVPQVIQWLEEGFQAFVDVHIKCYANYQEVPVHFVGSVAFHFSDVLRRVCEKEHIRVGTIEKRPIDGLARYHAQFILPKI